MFSISISWRFFFGDPRIRIVVCWVYITARSFLETMPGGVPRTSIIAFWDLYWGPEVSGSYHMCSLQPRQC